MCGKLTTYLRMCGYDAAYALDRDVEADDRLLSIAREERRIIITRDRQLAARTENALLLESKAVVDQLRELRDAGFRLSLDATPTYCGACNGLLDRVPSGTVTPGHAPDPGDEQVWRCRSCGQLFWKGSHWEQVKKTLSEL